MQQILDLEFSPVDIAIACILEHVYQMKYVIIVGRKQIINALTLKDALASGRDIFHEVR